MIAQFQDRLEFGVQRELIDLCRLTCLNGQRARVLFNSGIDSICILANSKIEDIENILQNCAPFERYVLINYYQLLPSLLRFQKNFMNIGNILHDHYSLSFILFLVKN